MAKPDTQCPECGYHTYLVGCPHCGNTIDENLRGEIASPKKRTVPYFNKTLVEGTKDYDKFQMGDL